MRTASGLAIGCLLALSLSAGASDDDIYGESATRGVEAPERAGEGEVRLPDYPGDTGAIEVPIDLDDFPFTLLIDPGSVSVDNRRDVRYTVILKSNTGASNVAYEAIRCDTGQYRRYAYGSSGRFKPLGASEWRYIQPRGPEAYRQVLMRYYLCPLPARREAETLVARLRRGGPVSPDGGP